jgi:hypothetical protein
MAGIKGSTAAASATAAAAGSGKDHADNNRGHPQSSPKMAHKGIRQTNQARRQSPFIHQLPGEHEERDGIKTKLSAPARVCWRKFQGNVIYQK